MIHITVQHQKANNYLSLVSRDYLRPIGFYDYINGRHSFASLVYRGPKEMLGVDAEAKEIVLQKRVIKKYEGGTPRVSSSVTKVREYLSKNGTGPFDEIWFISHNIGTPIRPYRIWPSFD